ncbi:hypothetical protein C8247_00520 [Paracidovorax avenae]|uniref:hypothetical protein n=1 Tax=Paracidovorax avenae TaxID=80867 RepID=UPI000D16AB7D|nr:hypothetical protein [Paracidovorax avenae]AVS69081.1 hypothetical protein C8247_00520 [Paracidovorax avenae]
MHTIRSPDGLHRADLRFEGEIRFGPEYFRLTIDGREVPHRIFGRPLCWSPDSRIVVAQEWLTTDYGEGPVTFAALIDVQAWAIARQEVAVKGFAEDFRFDARALRYRLRFPAMGEVFDVAMEMDAVHAWTGIDVQPRTQAPDPPHPLRPL